VDAPAVFVSSIALGVCVDDTIHFLAAVRLARQSGLAGVRALCCALANVGHALVTTTIVLVVGFGVLIGAEFRPNVVIGQLAVPMFALALFTTLLITPALLCVLAPGRRQKEELPKTALVGSSGV
jgi:predicted RND superfamily exporter protein